MNVAKGLNVNIALGSPLYNYIKREAKARGISTDTFVKQALDVYRVERHMRDYNEANSNRATGGGEGHGQD